MLKSFHGRLYFNLSQLRRACAFGGVAPAEMLRSMGHAGAIQPSDETPAPRAAAGAAGRGARPRADAVAACARGPASCARTSRRMRRELDRLAAADPQRLPDARRLGRDREVVRGRRRVHADGAAARRRVVPRERRCARRARRSGFPFEQLVYPQLAVGESSVSAQQAFDLVALADVARREPRPCVSFLRRERRTCPSSRRASRDRVPRGASSASCSDYGHRGRYESDWALPRYSEDPTPLFRALRAHVQDGADRTRRRHGGAPGAREPPRRGRRSRSGSRGGSAGRRCRASGASIRAIKQYYVWREQVRSDLVRLARAPCGRGTWCSPTVSSSAAGWTRATTTS